ncbi:emp24/gp25L/p24 family/GOLD-domain-containing protein [Globomyces pollinis-pini]|nr:emp24/gp25L/p24 family/GOLD-domain-containing protein [Globomyces pollinis-pini]
MKFGLLLISTIYAVTVSYRMAPHERACFYVDAKQPNEKLAFYFAVQEGGDFDIDYDLNDPNSKIILTGQAERQGDFVLTAKLPGEYGVCFSNSMSTFAEKLIDFDLTIEHEVNPAAYHQSEIEESVAMEKLQQETLALSSSLSSVARMQRVIRTKEHRNKSTIKDTEGRLFWFAIIESLVMVAMAAIQVYAIQSFFSKSGRTRV